MSDLWPRIEPLLARVEKPARYIGMERGSAAAGHEARPGCLPPDLSRHLRDRPPQPGAPDPLRDPERARRRGRRARLRAVDRHGGVDARRRGVPLFSVDTHRAAARLRRARLQPLGRARLHEPAQPASTSRACRCATRTARPRDPIVIAGGHCAYNPEPLAEYVDAFVIGDGEEVVGEIAEVVGAWKRGGRAIARGRAARPRHDPRRLRARRCTTSSTTAPVIRAVTPALRRRARGRRQAHGRRPRRLAVPEAAARAARRGRARPAQRRDLPRLHARLPLLPGRHDHPPGARAARGAGAHDGARGPAPHRLRRGRAHVAVERRLLRASTASSPTS